MDVLFDGLSWGVGAPLRSVAGVTAVVISSLLPATETASVSRWSRRFFNFSPGLVDQRDSLADAILPQETADQQ